jgi:hypothetical protein
MKIRNFLVPILLLLAASAHADDRTRVITTDASVAVLQWSTNTFSTSNVTIASTTGRGCLTGLQVNATNYFTLRVLQETATTYTLSSNASSYITAPFSNGSPHCGAATQRLFINVSCSGCAPEINYQAFQAQ